MSAFRGKADMTFCGSPLSQVAIGGNIATVFVTRFCNIAWGYTAVTVGAFPVVAPEIGAPLATFSISTLRSCPSSRRNETSSPSSAPRTALPRGLETERCPLSKSFLPSTIVTERERVSSERDKTTLSPTAMP